MNVNTKNLITTLPKNLQRKAKFIAMKENDADLSTMRIGQEVATNLFPKAVFARGLVDLCDKIRLSGHFIIYKISTSLGSSATLHLLPKQKWNKS